MTVKELLTWLMQNIEHDRLKDYEIIDYYDRFFNQIIKIVIE